MANKQIFGLSPAGWLVALLAVFLTLFIFKADIVQARYPCVASSCGCGTCCDGITCTTCTTNPCYNTEPALPTATPAPVPTAIAPSPTPYTPAPGEGGNCATSGCPAGILCCGDGICRPDSCDSTACDDKDNGPNSSDALHCGDASVPGALVNALQNSPASVTYDSGTNRPKVVFPDAIDNCYHSFWSCASTSTYQTKAGCWGNLEIWRDGTRVTTLDKNNSSLTSINYMDSGADPYVGAHLTTD